MTSNICQRLLDKVWRSYVDDLDKVPEAAGIYAIGDGSEIVLYVGQSQHMRTRLRQHKSGHQAIDQLVKQKNCCKWWYKPTNKMGGGPKSQMCGGRVPRLHSEQAGILAKV